MKSKIIFLTVLLFTLCTFSQEEVKFSKENLKIELADKACLCIDSINTYDKSKKEIVKKIHKCIDAQTSSFQMMSKLMGIDELKKTAKKNKKGKKEVNITINVNKESQEYKNYYFDLERYLMINCSSLKNKISKDGKLKENSLSKDPKALKFYNKGLDETSKKDYKKAIENYKKAVKIDSNFTFAWDNMGICYRRLENYDKAIESYKKSLEIDPYGVMPLQNIAVAYAYDKQYEEAINAYKKLSELDSNNPEVYYGIGQIYYEYIKDYEKSLSNLSKAYNLYIAQKSPYRSDAEKIISYIYTIMKKEGKLAVLKKILQDNNIKFGK